MLEVVAEILARVDIPILARLSLPSTGVVVVGSQRWLKRLRRAVPDTRVVHTHDIAWHSRFGWDDLIASGLLRPLVRGDRCVTGRPPAIPTSGRAQSRCPKVRRW